MKIERGPNWKSADFSARDAFLCEELNWKTLILSFCIWILIYLKVENRQKTNIFSKPINDSRNKIENFTNI